MDRLAGVEQSLTRVDLVPFEQGVADRIALGRQKREAHAPTDRDGVDDTQQRVDHPDLVRHFRSAEDGDERPLRVLAQTEQHLDFASEQAPRG
jgi:hypothetical protein